MARTKSTAKFKFCPKCQQYLPKSYFGRLARAHDGLYFHCKACEHLRRQPLSPLEAASAFWIVGAEGIEGAAFCTSCERIVPLSICKKDNRGYRRRFLICRPCSTAQRTAWRAEHAEQDRITILRNWHRHSDRYHVIQRAAQKKRLQDPEKRAHQYALVAAWYAADPLRTKTKNSKHRARLQNAPLNDVTDEQWQAVIDAAKGRCAYCPVYKPDCKACTRGRHTGMTVDHITALANGGSNTLHNLVACCRSCNSTKYVNQAPLFVQPLLL